MMVFNSPRQAPGVSLWRDMMRLQDEMNSLVSRASRPATAFAAVNVWVSEESAVVTTELPGVELKDIEIVVVGDTLTLRGMRNPVQLNEGDTFHRRERTNGRFTRVLQLPFRIESDEVSATLRNGLLNITLPRAHADRPRKIQVKTS